MIDGWVHVLVVVAIVGTAIMAGIFFAFSNFMMQSLDGLAPGQAITAMQLINRRIITPLFVAAFLGTAAVCGVLAVASLLRLDEDGAPLVLAGSLLYLLGSIVMTIAYHVPKNLEIDAFDATSSGAADYWERFVRVWTRGNHVRSLACTGAVLCFALALG